MPCYILRIGEFSLGKGECLLYSPSWMAWEKENAMLYIENRRMLLRKRRMPILYSRVYKKKTQPLNFPRSRYCFEDKRF